MAVGFDIDDTVLFQSGFLARQNLLARKRRLSEKILCSGEKMNNGWDEFSIPKEVARQLIDMHVRRGDAIFL